MWTMFANICWTKMQVYSIYCRIVLVVLLCVCVSEVRAHSCVYGRKRERARTRGHQYLSFYTLLRKNFEGKRSEKKYSFTINSVEQISDIWKCKILCCCFAVVVLLNIHIQTDSPTGVCMYVSEYMLWTHYVTPFKSRAGWEQNK